MIYPHLGRANHRHDKTLIGGGRRAVCAVVVVVVVDEVARVGAHHCHHVAGVQLSKSEWIRFGCHLINSRYATS